MVQREKVAGALQGGLLCGCELGHPGHGLAHAGRVVSQVDGVRVQAQHEVQVPGCCCLHMGGGVGSSLPSKGSLLPILLMHDRLLTDLVLALPVLRLLLCIMYTATQRHQLCSHVALFLDRTSVLTRTS